MKQLLICLTVFCSCAYAQLIKPSDLTLAGGFLSNCDSKPEQLSKANRERISNAPSGQVFGELNKAMNEQVANYGICVAYLSGIIDGWREGHEHGVIAAQFPSGYPKDLPAALKTLPKSQLDDGVKAMKSDMPCLPEHVTNGELMEAALRYMRKWGTGFGSAAYTSRMVHFALMENYACRTDSGSNGTNVNKQ